MSQAIFVKRRGMRPAEVRTGWVDGYRICFNLPVGPGERGVANLEVVAGARTHGVLYLLTAAEVDLLDRTEGVHRGYYDRMAIDVAAPGGGSVAAVTYRSVFASPGRKPSARYLGLLLDGAREHGLPEDYIRFLESFELAFDERTNEASRA